MSKKKRIKELERRVANLETRLWVQEAQPKMVPQPHSTPFRESPFKYGTGDPLPPVLTNNWADVLA